jgi:uncharacterized Zn-binding protein involved in type VI secretion
MSSQPITRINDKTTGHGNYKPRGTLEAAGAPGEIIGGSDNVKVNNKGVNRVGDFWKNHAGIPDSKDKHSYPNRFQQTTSGDNTVLTNGQPTARIGDKVDGDDTIAGGSPNVFAGDNNLTPEVQYIYNFTEVDYVNDSNAPTKTGVSSQNVTAGLKDGVIKQSTIDAPIVSGPIDSKPPANPPSTAVPTNFDQYTQDNIDYKTLMLTDKTSLATFTLKATLWGSQPTPPGPNTPWPAGSKVGDNKHIKAQYGLTVPQILSNMANLAKNIWEPLKAQYPNAIITNTFRQGRPGGQNEQAQHGRGQAMDLKFGNLPRSDYYNIACWIRDNLPFDQLLQEYCGDKFWIHVSHYSGTGQLTPTQNKVATVNVAIKGGFVPGLRQLT